MGVSSGGATLEIQLVADVARLQRDMNQMKQIVGDATASSTRSFAQAGAGSAVAATQMAAGAQSMARAAVTGARGFNSFGQSANNSRIVLLETTHIAKNLTEQLASGVSPVRAFTSEIGRMATLVEYSNGNIGGAIKQFAQLIGIIKVTTDATLEAAAATAATATAAVARIAERTQASLVARQAEVALAKAQLAAADTAEAETAAQARLVKALRAVQVQAEKVAIAQQALATAETESSAAGAAAAAASTTRFSAFAVASAAVLAGLAVAGGFAYASIKNFQDQVKNSGDLDRYRDSLGLTRKEMLKLSDGVEKVSKNIKTLTSVSLTTKDVLAGLWKTISDDAKNSALATATGPGTWNNFKENSIEAFHEILNAWVATSEGITAGIYGTYNAARLIWHNFPAMMGDFFVQAANMAIHGINELLGASVTGINWLISHVNAATGMKILDTIAPPAGINEIVNRWKGAGEKTGAAIASGFSNAYKDAQKSDKQFWDQTKANAEQNLKDRMKAEADALKALRTPKKDKKQNDHGLQEALDLLDAQIDGQKKLAVAYQISDAAAMKAEALQKAEEQAIRHKGEVGLFYEKELQLAVAKSSAESAKTIGELKYETEVRSQVNDAIAAGIVPASRFSEELEFLSKRRQLEAALAIAEEQGWNDEVVRLTAEISNLWEAQKNSNSEIARTAALQQEAKNDDEIEKLKLEVSLIGASNKERAIRLAQLEAEKFIRDNNIKNPKDAADIAKGLVDAAVETNKLEESNNSYNHSLTETYDMLKLIADQVSIVGQTLSDAFGQVGQGIANTLNALVNYQAEQAQIQTEADAARKKAGDDVAELARIEAEATEKSKNSQLKAIGGVISGLKGLFKEHSAGYRIMDTIEKAYAIASIARTIASIAPRIAAAAAKMFEMLGPFGFAAVAAMIAVMAALGFSGGSSSGTAPTSATDLQAAAGAGTVLGDSSAKSDSIANSLSLMAQNSVKGLDVSNAMAHSLRNIENDMGNLTAALARSIGMSGGFFDTTGKVGTSTSNSFSFLGAALGGLLGGLLGGKSTSTKTLYDQGITISPAALQQIIEQGVSGATYMVIQTVTKKSGFLGIGGSTKTSYDTTTGALDGDVSRQFQLIITDLYNSVVGAAKVFGLDVSGILKTFTVDIGKISFKDLTGDQIQQQLNAVFSKLGDQMAGFAVAGLAQFQKAGEGLFETLMRLAKDYLTVDAALKSIGLTFGSVGVASIAAREALINLMGGLDQFVSQINYYYENFLTSAEQNSFLQQQIDATFTSLGIAEPTTIDAFKALVNSLDLTTAAGQATFAALMAIAPAFYQVTTAADQAAAAAAAAAAELLKKQQDLQIQLYQAQGNTAAATALQRQITLSTLDPSLVDLQKQVWAAQDAAAAAAKALEIKNKRDQMQVQLLQAEGKATEALALQRKIELAALDPALQALQKQIYAAEDVATAKSNLIDAYKRESEALQATADKFHKFADDLKAFRDSLFMPSSGPTSYNQALINLMKQSGLAVGGNETALGGGLQDAAQKFLDIATTNAGSLADVARARALVAQQLDQAISAANNKGTIADQQLATMKDQVSHLVDINDSVLSVADAISQLTALLSPTTTPTGTTTGGTHHHTPHTHAPHPLHAPETHDVLTHIHTAIERVAVNTGQYARVIKNADRGGSLAVVTDKDQPLKVESP